MKILLCPRASALRDSLGSQRTLHTFANHTSQRKNLNLQKSAIFTNTLTTNRMILTTFENELNILK